MLKDKKIVLGVTGGIAAYKAVEIVSRLRKAGAAVKVVMTENAAQFVAPLTFREISGHPVAVSMWEKIESWNVEHIALATWADLFLIAPATADVIGKIAVGIADDLLTTAVMATHASVILSPAMNCNMYLNPIVQQNIARLKQQGYIIVDPERGMLACGVDDIGRLPDPAAIVARLEDFFTVGSQLKGKNVIVTAAGTIEPIDPVRYIGNRSSGKMGYAIANEAARRGAKVTIVSGPTAVTADAGIRVVKIETAEEMRRAVLDVFSVADFIVKAAAVADYRAKQVAEHKIKKSETSLILELEKNPDILLELGQKKRAEQFLVGFAAETQDLLLHATEKLQKKNLDMLVANDVSIAGSGFNADENIVKLLYRNAPTEELPCMRKDELAKIIWDRILLRSKKT